MKQCIMALILSTFTMGGLYATPDNIAPLAKAKASSEKSSFPASGVNDGVARIMNSSEWVSESGMTYWGQINYPSIELTWDSPKTINRILLYDRPTEESHVAGGTIHFSDGSKIFVNQIPNDGSPRAVDFPARTVTSIRFEVTDADGLNVGLSEIEVFPDVCDYKDYVEKVDPFIESARGRYIFFLTGQQPFGMISSAPLTRNKNQYGGGYNYNSKEILGFPQVHGWMNAGIVLMPTTGVVATEKGEQSWKSPFSHDGEIARPGYHKLFLDRYNLWVEQTATHRVSFHRYTYCDDAPIADVLLNLGGYVSTATMTDADVQVINGTEIVGSVNTTGRLWGGPDNIRIFFIMRFDKPVITFDGWDDQKQYANIKTLKGTGTLTPRNHKDGYQDAPSTGVRARFSAKRGEQRLVKVAVSYTSIDNARKNMDTDCNHWDFDRVCAESRQEWNDMLGRIDVKGGSDAQQVKFYTDLWHVLLGRHKIDDVSGDYPDYTTGGVRRGSRTIGAKLMVRTLPKDANGKPTHHMYNSDAFWLTQWNVNVLWGLAYPEVLDNMAASLVQYAENGGLLPRGPVVGGYSYIMTTCPATNLITAAYQKGMLTKVDPKVAFNAMVRNHKGGGMIGSKEQIAHYEKFGHYPNDAGQTLEACFQDWALSQMALKMGKRKEATYYLKRSKGWESLYNPELKLLMPKTDKGTWLHNDPLNGRGWVEANAWQATWSVSHGIERLAELMGGNDSLCAKLNYAFEMSRDQDFVFGYSDGYVSYANQPGCSNAHVFSHAGNPYLTQYWVRRVNEQAYGAITPDRGYGGHDEDQGQMGGVSALMSMGLFAVKGTCDIDPTLDITSPVFDKITIQLPKPYYQGNTFTIITHNNSDENCYIRRATLNGKPLDGFTLRQSQYNKGGVLELWMDNSHDPFK